MGGGGDTDGVVPATASGTVTEGAAARTRGPAGPSHKGKGHRVECDRVSARYLAVLLLCVACSSPIGERHKPDRQSRQYTISDFVRVVTEPSREGTCTTVESAAMSFTRNRSTVTLVAMVHIADSGFFASLDVHVRNATRIWAEGHGERGSTADSANLPTVLVKITKYYDLLSDLGGLENQGNWELRRFDSRWRRADIGMDEVRDSVNGDSLEWTAYERSVDAALKRLENLRGDPEEAKRQARAEVVRSIRAMLEGRAIGTPGQFGAHRERAVCRAIVEGAAEAGTAQTILFGAAHAPVIADEICRLGYAPTAMSWHVVLEVEDEPRSG